MMISRGHKVVQSIDPEELKKFLAEAGMTKEQLRGDAPMQEANYDILVLGLGL
jgi:hypothetical protein